MQCAQCQTQNDADLHFCESCGAPLCLACPSCGHALKSQAKFCGKCGAQLHGAVLGQARPWQSSDPLTPNTLTVSTVSSSESGERRQLTVLFCEDRKSVV